MKIVFFGSDDFAQVTLAALVRSAHQIVCCVTPPDKAKGRHLKVAVSPVAVAARKAKISVAQPCDMTDAGFIKKLCECKADLFVVVAYGKLLPKDVLQIPRLFCVNLHASLLPKYRGAAPINWAIINGETTTGLTIFMLDENMDSGDIIAQQEMPIEPDDTAITLRKKMTAVAGDFLVRSLDKIEADDYGCIKQDAAQVSAAPKLTKQDGLIDWEKGAVAIHNLVRGLVPWPGAFTQYRDKNIKIVETSVRETECGKFVPGEVMGITKDGFTVATGSGALCVSRVHLESAKEMDAASFVAGHKLGIGFKFGIQYSEQDSPPV